MSNNNFSFNNSIDQHYFHCIILKSSLNIELSSIWNRIGVAHNQENSIYVDPNFFEIQYKRVESIRPYTRGELLNKISISNDGLPPYLLDVFLIKTKIETEYYYIFCFPFVEFGEDIMNRLSHERIVREGVFVKVNILKLLQVKADELILDPLITSFKHLQCGTLGNNIHFVSIGGDNPLESELYLNFLKEKIEKGLFVPEQCAISANLKYSESPKTETESIALNLRSRIHIDGFGNYIFYLHISGKNLLTLPFLVQKIFSLKCFEDVKVNPLERRLHQTLLN